MIERRELRGFDWKEKTEFIVGGSSVVEIDDGNYGIIITRTNRDLFPDESHDWTFEVRSNDRQSRTVTETYLLSNSFGLIESFISVKLPYYKNVLGIDYRKYEEVDYDGSHYVLGVNGEHLSGDEREDYHDMAEDLLEFVEGVHATASAQQARSAIERAKLG